QREQLDALLDGFHDALASAIADGRGVTPERARELVDGAPYFGEAAIAAGLADALGYEDELPAILGLDPAKKKRGLRIPGSRKILDGDSYLALVKRPLVRPLLRRAVIAVVPVHGTIAHASGMFGSLATDERVGRMIRLARTSPRVRGVILHVDSPGGSALASDRMHHEIVQLAREKPVVACMANVAASGGYYVAAPAHKVVAEATTITGSIGVVAARLSIEPLLARLGISTETVRRGARAGLLAASTPLSDDEHRALEREIEATYGTFVRVVASGRKMSEDAVEPLARGRVYTGKMALDVGLVDVLGGFDAAVREVRAMLPAPLRSAEPQTMRQPRRPVPLPDAPTEGEAGRRAAAELLTALLPDRDRALALLAASGERILALWLGSID
ncbi:MAG TPA: signal peptide peptidase SppA, partial [Labilithrix sp.]